MKVAMPVSRCKLIVVLVLAGWLSGAPPPAAGAEGPPALGETKVFARVPNPGQPQGIVVDGDTVWTTSAAFMQPEVEDWPVWAFDRRTGQEQVDDTMHVRRHGPALMALSGMALDTRGRLYAVDMNGRILRTTDGHRPARGRTWEVYATIPSHGDGSAHAPWPAGSMPIDIAFDAAGNAYLSDVNFPGIWRVPPGGGEAELWFVDSRMQGYPFGVAAARIGPTGRDLYFTQCASGQPDSAAQGVIYRLPLDHPTADQLAEVHRISPGACPVALAFGASGKLYVALGNNFLPAPANALTNQILVLNADGTEALRFPSPGDNAKQEIPYDQPFFLAFDGDGWLLVGNTALTTPNSEHWAILKAFVNDTALPLVEPALP